MLVIGAGAAGLMCAYKASLDGARVTVLERNEKAGKKIYITGKGRCNVTNACSVEKFFDNVCSNPKFLYGAIHTFSSKDILSLKLQDRIKPIMIRKNLMLFFWAKLHKNPNNTILHRYLL